MIQIKIYLVRNRKMKTWSSRHDKKNKLAIVARSIISMTRKKKNNNN